MPVSSKNRFAEKVDRTISAHNMFQPGDSVLIGVSGGPDSVALFHVLSLLAPRYSLRLAIAHVDHCLRADEAERDARYVSGMAEKQNVRLFYKKIDVRRHALHEGLCIEEAGRQVRYRFFETTAETAGFDKIALGHQADDRAESVLMYLLRGSGPLGLSGIAPVRNTILVRPLIDRRRSEIIDFLEEGSIPYLVDSSNQDPRYLRNRIRHHLLPILKREYNPGVVDALNRLSEILRMDDQWMALTAEPVFQNMIVDFRNDGITLSLGKFDAVHPALQRRVLRSAIRQVKGNLRRIRLAHIDAARKLSTPRPEQRRLDLPDRIRILRRDRMLSIIREQQPLRSDAQTGPPEQGIPFEYRIREPGTIRIAEIGKCLKLSSGPLLCPPDFRNAGHSVAFFDMDRICFPLILRNVQPGDRFRPFGLDGSQKVKDFFINNKIPKEKRRCCPMLVSGNRIIWVGGYRIAESVKVTASTRRVLKAELFLA